MGTNGFTYTQRNGLTTATDEIEFNCFEFDSPNNEVLVAITKVSLQDHLTEDNVADHLKLDALLISNKTYLDKTWGKEKVYDSNYKRSSCKLPLNKGGHYSLRRLFVGFANAALIALKLTVASAMITVTAAEMPKTHHWSGVR